MSKQALKKFDLDPEKVEDMRKQLEEYAGDSDWTLEVVASNGVVKFQGIVADDEEEADPEAAPRKDTAEQAGGTRHPKTKDPSPEAEGSSSGDPANADEEPESTAGSEETFKDEL